MLKIWKKISEEVIYKNNWWEYRKDIFDIPNVKQGEYHYVHSRGSSLIIPMNSSGCIICVKQYRYLNKRFSIEFPCGGVLPGHSFFDTAVKELEEETGFSSKSIKLIGEFNPYNGVTNEICQVFVATDLMKCESNPDITEEFERLNLSKEEMKSMIADNQIWDGMTLAAFILFDIFLRKKK
jgi:ADP-ribose pyrophosphatase